MEKENVKIQFDKPTDGKGGATKPNGSDLTSDEGIQFACGIVKPTFKSRCQPNRLLLEWCYSDT